MQNEMDKKKLIKDNLKVRVETSAELVPDGSTLFSSASHPGRSCISKDENSGEKSNNNPKTKDKNR